MEDHTDLGTAPLYGKGGVQSTHSLGCKTRPDADAQPISSLLCETPGVNGCLPPPRTPYSGTQHVIHAYQRYEYLRALVPREFEALWRRNLLGEGHFDDLVDAAIRNQEKP